MSTSGQPPASGGSTPVGDDDHHRRRGAWWLWLLPLILIAVILLLVLSRCGGDDDKSGVSGTVSSGAGAVTSAAGSATASAQSATPTTTTATTTTAAPTSAAETATPTPAAGGDGSGQLTAGQTPLLPLTSVAGGDLSSYVGMPVTASGVLVQSVPADEGFWVGTSTTDRIWVQLKGSGESAFHVQKGDHVDFTAHLVKTALGFPRRVGVTQAEGADLLVSEKAHVQVETGDVQLSQG